MNLLQLWRFCPSDRIPEIQPWTQLHPINPNFGSSRVGFNVPPNKLYIGDPTNSVKALKDNSWSVYQAKPSTR